MSVPELKTENLHKQASMVKRIIFMAVFIALSAVGSWIKIPSPVGTIGLDSAPGYFSALAFGSLDGAIVIAIGHLLTAAIVGFPLTIPMHLLIAVLMALWAIIFRLINKTLGLIPAVIAAIFLNGVVSAFTMLPIGGMAAAIGLMPYLVIGSAINVIIAAAAYKAIRASKLI